MKTTAEKIEVMQAFERGERIQVYRNETTVSGWSDSHNPFWDWQIFNYRINPEQQQTDWSKVAVDTKVLVNKVSYFNPIKRYFSHYRDGKVYVFLGGSTSYSIGHKQMTSSASTSEVKLDDDIPNEQQSQLNWIKNIGVEAYCRYAVARYKDGVISNNTHVGMINFGILGDNCDIAEYAIIE